MALGWIKSCKACQISQFVSIIAFSTALGKKNGKLKALNT